MSGLIPPTAPPFTEFKNKALKEDIHPAYGFNDDGNESKTPFSLKEKLDKLREATGDIELTDDQSEQIKATVTTFSCLILEQILSQPFVTLRTQCQINVDASNNHIFPFSLLTPTLNLIKSQGILCLWKGMTTTLIVNGLHIVTENVLSDILQYPRDVDFTKASSKEIAQHLLLKSLSYAIITPFYVANILQNIQSYIIYSTVDDTAASGNFFSPYNNHVFGLFKDAYHITLAIFSSTFRGFARMCFKPLENTTPGSLLPHPAISISPVIVDYVSNAASRSARTSSDIIIKTLPITEANFLTRFLFLKKFSAWSLIPICVTFYLTHYLVTRYFETLIAKVIARVERDAKRQKRKKRALRDPAYHSYDRMGDEHSSTSAFENDSDLNTPHSGRADDIDFVHVRPASPSKRRTKRKLDAINRRILASLAANFGARQLADMVCYPLLCAANILMLRGLMTNIFVRRHVIIDDLDSGLRIEPLGHHYLSFDHLVLDSLSNHNTNNNTNGRDIGIRLFKPLHLFRGFGTMTYLALMRYSIVKCAEIIVQSPFINHA